MLNMSEKVYCGNARKIATKFSEIIKVSFNKDDINKMVKWMKDEKSDWVNIAIMEKRSPEQGKPTHYGVIDDWKPEAKNEATKEPELPPSESLDDNPDDDLPF
jgi:hypothetical protein